MSAGTYLIRAGSAFYIGSSLDLLKRRYDHSSSLKRGVHHSKKLQKAFDELEECEFIPHAYMRPEKGESTEDFKQRVKGAEQALLDELKGDPELCNQSRSAFGPDNGDALKKRWEDPSYRRMMSRMAKGRKMSDETRRRMSEAKRGEKNHFSKPVRVIAPDGSETIYPSASEASKFFGVTQQLFDLWLKGQVKWPGSGRKPKGKNRWIIPYKAEMVSCSD